MMKIIYFMHLEIKSSNNLKNKNIKYFRQVLAYCFPRKKLLKFGTVKKKTKLEYFEDIEIFKIFWN